MPTHKFANNDDDMVWIKIGRYLKFKQICVTDIITLRDQKWPSG